MATQVHPQITALRTLQAQDRRLTGLERRLDGIPRRLEELTTDLVKLEDMLNLERSKLEETRAFQTRQELQKQDEEELIRNSKAKLGQVKTSRELNATQREIDSTRRMVQARTQEIAKLQEAVTNTENRISKMDQGLKALQEQASGERERLQAERNKLEKAIGRARKARVNLTSQIDSDTLRTYERVRRRTGGMAFVPASRERCGACKMAIPHINYMTLLKGQQILACENCSRLLYWAGHFKQEETVNEPAPKAAPKKKRTRKKAAN